MSDAKRTTGEDLREATVRLKAEVERTEALLRDYRLKEVPGIVRTVAANRDFQVAAKVYLERLQRLAVDVDQTFGPPPN